MPISSEAQEARQTRFAPRNIGLGIYVTGLYGAFFALAHWAYEWRGSDAGVLLILLLTMLSMGIIPLTCIAVDRVFVAVFGDELRVYVWVLLIGVVIGMGLMSPSTID
jgi:hypothetical protein